ncbi:reverse transcriptase domain-containing protein [Dactylosporangium sp. NPDC051541]|uniref:reverse transcriptase domain-containing protein n=1 Tax=Dactylosporangium sp. NPDC051541 TaxID=3363977 RepID=UPI0037B8BBA0
MQISKSVIDNLKLSAAADVVCGTPLDRFPGLVMDLCLEPAKSALVDSVVAAASAGHVPRVETLTLPRRGLGGPRPVTVLSPASRVLYTALVDSLSDELPSSPRDSDAWAKHNGFGTPGDGHEVDEYLVETDIASCYEYIDHSQLADQLILCTNRVEETGYLVNYLGEIHGRDRGLPQLMASSDVLADCYLQQMELDLLREEARVSRYADDFKMLAPDWPRANQLIENAAEAARRLGLILSTEKTTIRRADTVAASAIEESDFLRKYLNGQATGKAFDEWVEWGYGGAGLIAPEGPELVQIGMRQMLYDWNEQQADANRHFGRFLSLALIILQGSTGDRLSDDLLADVVFRYPLYLPNVVEYVAKTVDPEEAWETTVRLAAMARQSPWAKIWVVNLAGRQPSGSETCWTEDVGKWMRGLLSDRHEVVRAEAAWYLAGRNGIDQQALSALYREACSITRPALAAACGRMGVASTSGLAKALIQESKLSKAAFEWGANFAAAASS